MKLFEHPDFEQAILRASEHFREQGLRPAIIEKDYYVTEALRVIAAGAGDKVIFKGGTSLAKGWNLIQRFSEDIDIFLDPLAFRPELGKRAIDRELKKLRDSVGAHPALMFVGSESHTIGGFGRSDRFSYAQRFGGPGEVAPRVLVEAGTASGREPTAIVTLRSYLSQSLQDSGLSMGAEDEGSFPMRLLHFRRTFVEKMFAIHSKVELLKREGQALGTYARHYYDLFQLAAQPEVVAMLKSAEYMTIKVDYDQISRAHFPRSYSHPDDMRFAKSDALFPPANLGDIISAEYDAQCRMLCYGPYPSWAEVQARLLELRDLLTVAHLNVPCDLIACLRRFHVFTRGTPSPHLGAALLGLDPFVWGPKGPMAFLEAPCHENESGGETAVHQNDASARESAFSQPG